MKSNALWLAVLLYLPYASVNALERLFFTPGERLLLERRSDSNPPKKIKKSRPPAATLPEWEVNGTLSQNGKPAWLWIDGQLRRPAQAPLRVQPLDENHLTIKWRGQQITVKPGQRIEVDGGGRAHVKEFFDR